MTNDTKYCENWKIKKDTGERMRKYGTQVIYPELSFTVNGVLFEVHKEKGTFGREKQYGDLIEKKLQEKNLSFQRKVSISGTGNILDFVVDGKIVLELKCVPYITREHYRQIQHYLQQSRLKLGILVNFREKFLKPVRVVRIELNHPHL